MTQWVSGPKTGHWQGPRWGPPIGEFTPMGRWTYNPPWGFPAPNIIKLTHWVSGPKTGHWQGPRMGAAGRRQLLLVGEFATCPQCPQQYGGHWTGRFPGAYQPEEPRLSTKSMPKFPFPPYPYPTSYPQTTQTHHSLYTHLKLQFYKI